MEGLWRGWRFAMIGMKKLRDISDVACILSSNGNARVLLTFIKNSAGFVIPDAIKYNLMLNTFHKMHIQISSSEA